MTKAIHYTQRELDSMLLEADRLREEDGSAEANLRAFRLECIYQFGHLPVEDQPYRVNA